VDDLADLLSRRVDTLYEADDQGRIVRSNEWDSRPAPRTHVMFTAHGAIARFRGDVPDHLAATLDAICRREPLVMPGADGPTVRRELMETLGDYAPIQQVWCGPAYRLPKSMKPEAGLAIPIRHDDAQLLASCFPDWGADVPHRQPFVAVVEAGEAVCLCASVRISAAVHCAGVETHADYRQRGHALSAVAAWARAVRALGATPFYSTSWDNVASQRVAGRLGFEMVGVDFHVS
jgi:hypothetical protein